MKTMPKLAILLALAMSAFAQDSCPKQAIYAGAGITGKTTSGVGAYLRRLGCIGDSYGVYSYTAANLTSIANGTPAYTISSGAALKLFQFKNFGLYGIGDVGIAQEAIAANKAPVLSLEKVQMHLSSLW